MSNTAILKKMAPHLGLREVVHPDGGRQWMDHAPIGSRESVTPDDIVMIARTLGMGAILLDLKHVDYTRGALQFSAAEKHLWTTNGNRIQISMGAGGIIGSITPNPDPEIPPAVYDDPRPGRSGIEKCIHPECYTMVDLSKRKSGACSKAHMNYECMHPDCIKRANENGWSRATHPFGSRIAETHWQYRKQEQ